MKTKRKMSMTKSKSLSIALILSALVFLCSCVTYTQTMLIVSPEEGSEAPGTVAAQADDGLQMVVASSYFDGSNADFVVSLASTEDSTFTFADRQLSIYGGNYQTGRWSYIDSWDSYAYKNTVKRNANTAAFAAGLIGMAVIFDAIFNPSSDFDVYYYSVYPFYNGGYYFKTNDPGVAITYAVLSTIETAVVMDQISDMKQAELNRTLLETAIVSPKSGASGRVCFTDLPKYPDYKVVYDNGNQNMQFTFSRSDRAEIINPWLDKSSSQFALNFLHTFNSRRFSATLSYLAPMYMGWFGGVSVFLGTTAHLPYDIGVNFGLNWKIMSHLWLQGGVEFCKRSGTEYPYDVLWLLGLQGCFSNISVYAGTVFSTREKVWFTEFGLGVAF